MAVSQKQLKAQQIRDDYIKYRAQRAQAQPRQVLADLKPPDLSAAMADATDGTLIGPLLANGLSVGIEWWDNLPDFPGDDEVVSLHLAKGHDPIDANLFYTKVDEETYTVPDYPDKPRDLKIPAENLAADGKYTLKYSLRDYKHDEFWSAPFPIICDQTPPRGVTELEPAPMTFPAIIITDAEVNNVVGTIPRYLLWSEGDSVIYGWERDLPANPEDLPYEGPVPLSNSPQTVTFDPNHIKRIGDGHCFIAYAIYDKARNRSRFAGWTRVHVALGPLPTNLHLPKVDLADDGIDIEDAIAGIWVDIPLYDNWKPRDQIAIMWGATELDIFDVGPTPNPELSLRVPSDTLRAEYGSATGNKPTEVSYRVLRGGAPFGGKQAITVDVNFSFIGPPRPLPDITWPDPVNRDLEEGNVRSHSGKLNVLEAADETFDADFIFHIYDPVKDGETIKFYWSGIYMPEADITIDGEVAGEEVTVTVLWKYIEQAGNSDVLTMHYRIGGPDTPNEQQSPPRDVIANAVVLRPDAATFRDVNGAGWLTCKSLDGPDNAIVVLVPDLSEWLAAGDTVDMKWWALPGRTGEPAPITDTPLDETITLTDAAGAYPVTGFEWRVQPYDKHVLPTYVDENDKDGRGRVTYGFKFKGVDVTSKTLQANVGMHESTTPGSCPI
ncbi:hypothetical protein [Pseudomonas sp. KK4]|uniref:hypothetical protein n=1 Tax=Pseudomonas sp. KK4 TaxID=1855729 RepID=UPI00097C7093|nr:hypothetical protein [Pseudomonas sp. KK4]